MGSWAKGPFDNDTALDWLDDLAEQEGLTWNADKDEYAGQPDEPRVQGEMTRRLERLLSDASDDFDAALAYAALGLMAVALAQPEQLARTIAGDDRPFVNGVTYRPLLSRAAAEALLPLAEPALQAVFDPTSDWYNLWFEADGLDDWRAALAQLLGLTPGSAA